jgi:hypothetical protein
MSISKYRGYGYSFLKFLGWIQAIQNKKIGQRIVRVQEGKMASRGMSKVNNQLFKGGK